jgi:hypothetical protein
VSLPIFRLMKDYIIVDWSWTKHIPPYFRPLTWSVLGFALVFWVPMGITDLFLGGRLFLAWNSLSYHGS